MPKEIYWAVFVITLSASGLYRWIYRIVVPEAMS